MTYLLDTHVLMWWLADDPRLSSLAREALADRGNALLWSVASTWELAIKSRLGKLRLPEPIGPFLRTRLARNGIALLQITHDHAAAVEALPLHHRDPFDRMLVAQANIEKVRLLTGDPRMKDYGVEIAW